MPAVHAVVLVPVKAFGDDKTRTQQLGGDGLGDEVIDAGVERAREVLRRPAAGEEQQKCVRASVRCADSATQLDAIKTGHHPIENHQGMPLPLERIPRRWPILDGGDVVPHFQYYRFEQKSSDAAVFR